MMGTVVIAGRGDGVKDGGTAVGDSHTAVFLVGVGLGSAGPQAVWIMAVRHNSKQKASWVCLNTRPCLKTPGRSTAAHCLWSQSPTR